MGMPIENNKPNENSNVSNPEWNDLLGSVPEEYHSDILPHLQTRDKGFEEQLAKVQSSYEPYQEFIKNNVNPDHIRISLGLAQALEERPEEIYKALHEQFGDKSVTKTSADTDEDYQEETDNPFDGLNPQVARQFQEMQQQVTTMRDILLGQKEQEDQAAQDKEIADMHQRLQEQSPMYKELNKDGLAEPYLNAMFIAGYNEKDALDQFASFVDAVKTYANRPKPPQIMGAGGFMPERAIKPSDLNPEQTRKLVHQMIMADHGQE